MLYEDKRHSAFLRKGMEKFGKGFQAAGRCAHADDRKMGGIGGSSYRSFWIFGARSRAIVFLVGLLVRHAARSRFHHINGRQAEAARMRYAWRRRHLAETDSYSRHRARRRIPTVRLSPRSRSGLKRVCAELLGWRDD